MIIENEFRRGVIEALGGLNAKPLPSEAERTEAYNDELVRRYLTGQFLTATDKREAKALIAAQAGK